MACSMSPRRETITDVETGLQEPVPKPQWPRILGLILQLPLLALILLEVALLASVWRASLAQGAFFGAELDQQQRGKLSLSMANYLVCVAAFVCVWGQGLSRPVCGVVCLGIWASFVIFGHEATAEAFDALCYLGEKWATGQTKPFAFSSSAEVPRALLAKVLLQSAYAALLFVCYKVMRAPRGGLPREEEAPRAQCEEEDSSPTASAWTELAWQRLRALLDRIVAKLSLGLSCPLSGRVCEIEAPLPTLAPAAAVARLCTREEERAFLPLPEMNVRAPRSFRDRLPNLPVVTVAPTTRVLFAPAAAPSPEAAHGEPEGRSW